MANIPIESEIETFFTECIDKHLPWVEHRKYKTRRNDPDRIIFFNNGRVEFVELKRPKKGARSGQLREHDRLRKRGFVVEVVTTKDEVWAWIQKRLQPTYWR